MRPGREDKKDLPATRWTEIWFLDSVHFLHSSSRLSERPLLLTARSLASPMLIEARTVMFPEALIVMCPPGKHGAEPSAKLIMIYSIDDIEND